MYLAVLCEFYIGQKTNNIKTLLGLGGAEGPRERWCGECIAVQLIKKETIGLVWCSAYLVYFFKTLLLRHFELVI